MISVEDLREIAKLKGIRNLDYAEKDYLQDILLLSISRNTKDELVFKGGTCLFKFYKLDRFSEDLDFTLRKEIDMDGLIKKIVSDLMSFGIESEVKRTRKVFNSVMTKLGAKGPLYEGSLRSISGMRIDINLKSTLNEEPLVKRYTSLYPDIPSFSSTIMMEKEILAEKVRAIMTRTKARDVYDLWFLLENKRVEFDEKLVREKLAYYDEKWNAKEFKKKLKMRESLWMTELEPLIERVPDFKGVRKSILEKI